MNINWKVRFKNKTWLLTFCVGILAFVYQVLGLFGVVPSISQETVVEIIGMVVNILVMLGIVVDPTSSGITDSARALTYEEPNKEK